MGKLEKIFDKLMPHFMKFANSKPVLAIKDGFILTMPMTMIGSLFLLIACFPIKGWDTIMANIFGEAWAVPLNQVVGASFDILALVGVFGIAYSYAKNEGIDGIASGILGIVSFLIITSSSIMTESGELVGGIIPKGWTGGKGVIAAIIVGLFVGYVYSWFIKRDIRIKMPDGVPAGVANSFSALIPAFVIMTTMALVYAACNAFAGMTFTEVIYEIIQIPLQNLSDTLWGAISIMILMSVLWWCGIHGAAILMGIIGPLLTANALANQAILDAGQAVVVGENAKIVTIQFLDVFTKLGGSGITIGLVIAAVMVAKSGHMKELGKLSLTPSLFNINEPVIFGLPIVFNPVMFVPFVIVPALACIIVYFAIITGFMPTFNGLQVPWTTPPVISGFILAGWQGALVQIATIAMSVAIYLPFLKMQDKISYEEETKNREDKDESSSQIVI